MVFLILFYIILKLLVLEYCRIISIVVFVLIYIVKYFDGMFLNVIIFLFWDVLSVYWGRGFGIFL